jgi:hypothetical protein
MQNNSRTKVVFKDYSPNQILLLPPSLEEMIDPNHPVRVVNQVIDSLDIDACIREEDVRVIIPVYCLSFWCMVTCLTNIPAGKSSRQQNRMFILCGSAQ